MQEFTAPLNTTYKIECWGARGGGIAYKPWPCGAYSSGIVHADKHTLLYVYVGQEGANGQEILDYRFNGGGVFTKTDPVDSNNNTGGGATDIRLVNGDWDDFASLKSRILIAAGGGGMVSPGKPVGYGGNLTSSNASYDEARTANGVGQNYGYKFGIGQSALRAGGGGGYYGGNAVAYAATGGSSFISGYTGCDAISESSTEDNIIHTGQPNHYSGYVFTNSVMIAGDATMPKPGGGTETGHPDNGYCIISWISPSL